MRTETEIKTGRGDERILIEEALAQILALKEAG